MRSRPIFMLFLLHCLFQLAVAAEELAKPNVPDPFGLGERLALVDYLRDTCKLNPPVDATTDQLVVMYWKFHQKEREAISANATDQALLADRIRRLRTELLTKHKIDAPADADEVALGKLLNEAKTKIKDQAMQQVIDKAAARDNPATLEEAARFIEQDRNAVRVRLDSIEQDEKSVQAEVRQIDDKRLAIAAQAKEQEALLISLRANYNEAVSKHNNLISLYDKKTLDGSTDALKTLEMIHAQKKVIEQAKAAEDQQKAVIENLITSDQALMARRKKLDESLSSLDQRRMDEQRKAGPGPRLAVGQATPGGVAEGPTAGSQQAKLVAGVVLLVVKNHGTGTGFFVTRDGLVVTNAHVLGSKTAKVTAVWDASAGRKPVTLRVIDYAEADDLALLKAESGAPFEPLPMSEVYELQRPLLSVGFPLAGSVAEALQTSPSDIVLSRGILGSVRKNDNRVEWLQHDCRVASGNSGGPVIDQQTGAVIGITTKVITAGSVRSHGDGINLAIPIRKVMDRFSPHFKP
jgi:S1-C subfamily serine protease